MFSKEMIKHGMEFVRALANKKFEITDSGIRFPAQKVYIAGAFDTWINGRDHQHDPNVVPTESLNYLLQTGIVGTGGLTAWNIAPFLTNVLPGATLTAATFTATQGEFLAYTQTTRQTWTVPATPTAGSFDNSAAPAAFTADGTVGVGVGVNVYGAGILSASAKSATTGKLLACSLFGAARNLKTGDILTVQYTLSATSTT